MTITAVNDAPVAVNDTANTTEDKLGLGNVLTNDTDIDSGTLTVATPAPSPPPTHVVLNTDGSYTYTPRPTTTHRHLHLPHHRRHHCEHLATVTMTVTAVNDTPVANNDSYTPTKTP